MFEAVNVTREITGQGRDLLRPVRARGQAAVLPADAADSCPP